MNIGMVRYADRGSSPDVQQYLARFDRVIGEALNRFSRNLASASGAHIWPDGTLHEISHEQHLKNREREKERLEEEARHRALMAHPRLGPIVRVWGSLQNFNEEYERRYPRSVFGFKVEMFEALKEAEEKAKA